MWRIIHYCIEPSYDGASLFRNAIGARNMAGIDDPYEAIEKQHIDESNPYFKSMLEVFGKVLGKFVPLADLVFVIQKQFSRDAAMARMTALFDQLIIDVQRHEKLLGKSINIEAKINTPEIAEVVLTTVNETVRTTNMERIKRFAAILGDTLTSEKKTNWDDASAYIRDIAQLGERDIEVLKLLFAVQKELFIGKNIPMDPTLFTQKNDEVLKLADEAGVPRDEFYSRCARLNGFGLALEVRGSTFAVNPGEHCFRMTTRARELIKIISD